MKLSDLIKKAEKMLADHGDLDILEDDGYQVYDLRLRVFEEDDNFLSCKKGDKIAWVHTSR